MKIRHKVYIFQIILISLVIISSVFTYKTYQNHYQHDLDEYAHNILSYKKKDFLSSFEYALRFIEEKQPFYHQVHSKALKSLRKNKNKSLTQLRKELKSEFQLSDEIVHLYLIKKDLVIYDATYKFDIGFDLSNVIGMDEQLDLINKTNDIAFNDGLVLDHFTNSYILYSLAKLDDDTYLEMGFISQKYNKKLKNVFSPEIGSKHTSDFYRVYVDKNHEYYNDINQEHSSSTKKELYDSKEKFYYDEETNNPIIQAKRTNKEIMKVKDNSITIFSTLMDNSVRATSQLTNFAVVIKMTIDITDKVTTLKKFQNTFIITISLLISFLVFGFLWIRKNFTETTDIITKHISSSKVIDDIELLNQNDEFGIIAKKYNTLITSLNEELTKNRHLLLDNKRFIADTVHQIRTPLSVILMNSDLIKLHQNDSNVEDFLNQINSSINMLTNSYEDLSYITSHDTIEYNPVHLHISKIIHERIDFFSTIVTVNYKSFACDIEDDIHFDINQIEFERIVDNNISNAIKYAKKDKPITVQLFKNNESFELLFCSYAKPIINPNRVFNKDYRENEEKRGLGLGLNMVQGICIKYDIEHSLDYADNQNIFRYVFKI
ncbi:HAMP domain-containing histidine kinase [Sulfurimonas sp.]|nr:HAMP domain-containing histidine kinase [Sulfurimonas sp.]